jgi:serine/threonine protein kinase
MLDSRGFKRGKQISTKPSTALTAPQINVLISGNGTAVLTDFGNSLLAERTLQFTQSTSRGNMTVRWAVRVHIQWIGILVTHKKFLQAPELISGTGKHSESADVYALGMVRL